MAYLSRRGYCSEPGCEENIFASGLCEVHRRRSRRGFPPDGAWKSCEACGDSFKPHGRQRWCTTCVPDQSARARIIRYGITEPQYREFLLDQECACAICGEEKPLVVDHCHETGVVRGLLCYGCNARLTVIDNVGWLESAMQYVKGGDRNVV